MDKAMTLKPSKQSSQSYGTILLFTKSSNISTKPQFLYRGTLEMYNIQSTAFINTF